METGVGLGFSSVVFGTDFSERSQGAGRYAALLARHFNADCLVTHAFSLVQPAMEVEALKHVRSQQRNELEGLLSETLKDLTPLAGRAMGILSEGRPLEVLRATSEQYGPSLVVLGTHGGGLLERHILGSVAEEILRTIESPVLTVGPHVAVPSSAALAFSHILYATDRSPAADQAVAPYAMALARAFGSAIDVLHVVSGETDSHLEVTEHAHASQPVVHGVAPERAAEPGWSTIVVAGNVRDRILEHASDNGVDLIVLGAHHHSWFARHLRTGPAFQIVLAPPARC